MRCCWNIGPTGLGPTPYSFNTEGLILYVKTGSIFFHLCLAGRALLPLSPSILLSFLPALLFPPPAPPPPQVGTWDWMGDQNTAEPGNSKHRLLCSPLSYLSHALLALRVQLDSMHYFFHSKGRRSWGNSRFSEEQQLWQR